VFWGMKEFSKNIFNGRTNSYKFRTKYLHSWFVQKSIFSAVGGWGNVSTTPHSNFGLTA